MICKTCGKSQHHCSSCGYDEYLDNGYCDRQCFENSDFYKQEKATFNALLDRMSEDSRRCVLCMFKSYHGCLHDYYDVWVEETLRNKL